MALAGLLPALLIAEPSHDVVQLTMHLCSVETHECEDFRSRHPFADMDECNHYIETKLLPALKKSDRFSGKAKCQLGGGAPEPTPWDEDR